MLLFSEVEEPEAAAELAEQSDQLNDDEYEAKISGLLRRAYDRDSQQGQKEGWGDAFTALGGGDYYILVMASQAGLNLPRPPRDTLKLLLTAIAVVIIALPVGFLIMAYGPSAWKRFEHHFLPTDFAHWVFFVLCIAAGGGGELIEKTDLVGKVVKRFGSRARAGE